MNYDSYLSTEIVLHIISINILLYVVIFVYSKLEIEKILALYNPFDPFFNFFQFFSYMFLHSSHIFLHIIFNMFILWIWGIHINSIYGHIKFIIIYFFSGIIAGLLQNMVKILIIYYYTGIFNLYKISHIFMTINYIQYINLQYSMYSPIIGSSGAISSIIGSFFAKNLLLKNKILLFNIVLYTIYIFFNIFPGLSHISHFSGAITGYYFYNKKNKTI